MLLTYYTLTSLAAEWDPLLRGAAVEQAYSQHRDELSIELTHPDGTESTLVILTRADQRLCFRNRGSGRARRNTAGLFPQAWTRTIERVRVAHRDRILFIDLEGGLRWQVVLFGPRPNVWLLVADGGLLEAMTGSDEAPDPRSAPEVADVAAFRDRWRPSGSLERTVSRAMPLFDDLLAAEAVHRASLTGMDPKECGDAEIRRLFDVCQSIEVECARRVPRIYWSGSRAEALSLIDMLHLGERGLTEEQFDSVDAAVRVFSHRLLAQERFDREYRPLIKQVRQIYERTARSANRMLEELESPSRADQYERSGHLLMAQATGLKPGAEEITLPDLMSDEQPVTIPLDAALSGIENAQQYYDRARRTRASREHALRRWEEVQHQVDRLNELLSGLEDVSSLQELEALKTDRGGELEQFLATTRGQERGEPFRRIALPGGYEAWVGKNARANAELTTRYAQPHDLWLHARGVGGSHVVIRRDSRTTEVPRPTIEAAARLAAYFSQARTSALVPVQVTERKYVRPLKGGPPGMVRLDREDVLMVEPRPPDR